MRHYWIDTSALFKRYQSKEVGAQVLDEIFASKNCKRVILNLTITEVISNFYRLLNENLLTKDDLKVLKSAFYRDMANPETLDIHDLNNRHINLTAQICEKKRQTPIDILQIAAALDFKKEDLFFVSCEERLNEGARLEGLRVLDPEEMERRGEHIPMASEETV
jgi:predicted nucleic acid-binding protein